MGQYHKLINLTKKEYVNPYDIGLGAKHLEGIGFEGSMGDVMYLLSIAQGNERRGGGDAEGHRYIGRWAGDEVVVVGDYYTEKTDNPKFAFLYDVDVSKDGKKYKNISASVRSMLSKVCDDLKFEKQIFKTKHLDGRVTESVHWERLSKDEYKKVKKSKPDMLFELSSKTLDEILTNK